MRVGCGRLDVGCSSNMYICSGVFTMVVAALFYKVTLKSRLEVFNSVLMAVVAAQFDQIKNHEMRRRFLSNLKKKISGNRLFEEGIVQTDMRMNERL